MTQLATVPKNGSGAAALAREEPPPPGFASSQLMTLAQVWEMAGYVADSKLFGTSTQEQAFALMMLAQSENLHPMTAMRRYHIIHQRPAMRADAMQAEFQAKGGRIKLIERSAKRAAAAFSHPTLQPEPVEFSFTMKEAEDAGVAKANPNYQKWPASMLWARLVSLAITTIDPGIKLGIYTPEEVEDMVALESLPGKHATAQIEADRRIAAADPAVPGWDPAVPDTRAYFEVVSDAVKAANVPGVGTPAAHKHLILQAINLGYCDGPPPASTSPAVKALTKVYAGRRDWVRSELSRFLAEEADQARLKLEAALAHADPDIAAAADVDDLGPDAGADG